MGGWGGGGSNTEEYNYFIAFRNYIGNMGREYMISVLIYLIYLGLYEQKSIYLGEEMRKQARKPDNNKKNKIIGFASL